MPAASTASYVVNRYDSLAELLDALATQPIFVRSRDAWVCIHPGLVRERSEYRALRRQVEAHGLDLLLTATADPTGVELRRYTA